MQFKTFFCFLVISYAACVQGYPAEKTTENLEPLTFDPLCGENVVVSDNHLEAQRMDPQMKFDKAIVLTKRPLQSNELFEVRVEKKVPGWMSTIKICLTPHGALGLKFPKHPFDLKDGTWCMSGIGVYKDGVRVIESYTRSLQYLEVGDRIGAMRKDDGSLHFFKNGVDQGLAASDVPEHMYGLVDVYSQVEKVSLVAPN